MRSSLKDGADNHDDGSIERGAFTTPGLTVEQNQDSAHEATNLIDGDTGGLGVGVTSAVIRVRDSVSRSIEPAEVIGARARRHERQRLLKVIQS